MNALINSHAPLKKQSNNKAKKQQKKQKSNKKQQQFNKNHRLQEVSKIQFIIKIYSLKNILNATTPKIKMLYIMSLKFIETILQF